MGLALLDRIGTMSYGVGLQRRHVDDEGSWMDVRGAVKSMRMDTPRNGLGEGGRRKTPGCRRKTSGSRA